MIAAGWREMITRINNTELYYYTQGTGMPLMLMHGGMGLDHTCFRPWLDPLAERMQLIYYDHRGNGRSARLTDFTGIDHTTWADDADKLRMHLGHDKIVLLGHSCGGFVAMEYALRYGKHLAGLILCCTTPAMDYPNIMMANAQRRSMPEQLPFVIKAFTEPFTSDKEMQTLYEKIFFLYFKSYEPQLAARITEAIQYNHHAFNYCVSTWFSAFSSLNRLGRITVPTLVIGGREDWIMPPAQGAERLHAALPHTKLVIFENSGHMPFIEEHALFIETVAGWIDRLE